MQGIRQYAIPKNGILTITVPEAFDNQRVEVQLVLAQEIVPSSSTKTVKRAKKPAMLASLLGKYKHYTAEQNEKIDSELTAR